MNTSPLRRQCSHCPVAVRISCLASSTTVVTSPLHRHPLCPRTASQRMLHTLTFTAAAAQGGAVAMNTSATTAPLHSAVKRPVSDRSERAVTRQRHSRRRRKSLLVCVQEPGICSIRDLWFRRNSPLHLRLTQFPALWSQDFSTTLSFRSAQRAFGIAHDYPFFSIPLYFSMRALYFSKPPKSAGNLMDHARTYLHRLLPTYETSICPSNF